MQLMNHRNIDHFDAIYDIQIIKEHIKLTLLGKDGDKNTICGGLNFGLKKNFSVLSNKM